MRHLAALLVWNTQEYKQVKQRIIYRGNGLGVGSLQTWGINFNPFYQKMQWNIATLAAPFLLKSVLTSLIFIACFYATHAVDMFINLTKDVKKFHKIDPCPNATGLGHIQIVIHKIWLQNKRKNNNPGNRFNIYQWHQ